MSRMKEMSNLSACCAEASAMYYNYLNNYPQKSKVITGVKLIKCLEPESRVWELVLLGKLRDVDSIVIRYKPTREDFCSNDFSVQYYDEKSRVLKIKFVKSDTCFPRDVMPSNVELFSDMRFLVKNVQEWYTQNGASLGIPSEVYRAGMVLGRVDNLDMPSPEQTNAITKAINSNLCYIWGPPGTGKTRLVLTHAVLSLAQIPGMRIGVFAPTNNALEQAMNAILAGAKLVGMPENLFMRLGTPSQDFLNEHPDVCEKQRLDTLIAQTESQISEYKKVHHAIRSGQMDTYNRGLRLMELYPLLMSNLEELLELESRRISAEKYVRIERRNEVLNEKILSKISELVVALCGGNTHSLTVWKQKLSDPKLRAEFADVIKQIDAYETASVRIRDIDSKMKDVDIKINSLYSIITSWFTNDRIEMEGYRENLSKQLSAENEMLTNLGNALKSVADKLHVSHKNEHVKIRENLRLSQNHLNRITKNIIIIDSEFESIKNYKNIFSTLVGQGIAQARKTIEDKMEEIQLWLNHEDHCFFGKYLEATVDEIEQGIAIKEEYLNEIKQNTPEERIKSCRVVGMTLDLLISRFQKGSPVFDHIFLDEAGYAPLIKAMVLFQHQSPVTFLGDHKQLPPVVEMDEKGLTEDEAETRILWGSSAIYANYAFTPNWSASSWLTTLNKIQKEESVDFDAIPHAVLTQSRRFGANICEELEDLIYNAGFTSANIDNVEIQVVDVPTNISENEKGKSRSEAEVINNIVRRMVNDDYAVITPYKNQVKLMTGMLSDLDLEDRILTIHKSQGREWDTVIISVVDGVQSKSKYYFTDTSKTPGSLVMNTAVSRAKRRLVIVCDKQYWLCRSDVNRQLISRLIAIGGEYA